MHVLVPSFPDNDIDCVADAFTFKWIRKYNSTNGCTISVIPLVDTTECKFYATKSPLLEKRLF